MIRRKKEEESIPTIDTLEEDVIAQIKDANDYTEDATTTMIKNLKTIKEAKSLEKDNSISKDSLFLGFVNLSGMLMVLNYERAYPVVSKAWGMITKLRP